MKFVNQSAIVIKPQANFYTSIELCGRVCYKSECKITKDSAPAFVDMLIKRGHLAMLEHGTVYLTIEATDPEYADIVQRYTMNKYSEVVFEDNYAFITTNFRVIIENSWTSDLLYETKEPTGHILRKTVKFICSRQVSHQFVRHRVFSFAQESTQYCNYSSNRFGKELTFIEPYWYASANWFLKFVFRAYLYFCEKLYMFLLKKLHKPHLAATVLPNATKTELCMTGFAHDWKNFIALRISDDNISQTYTLIKDLTTKL